MNEIIKEMYKHVTVETTTTIPTSDHKDQSIIQLAKTVGQQQSEINSLKRKINRLESALATLESKLTR